MFKSMPPSTENTVLDKDYNTPCLALSGTMPLMPLASFSIWRFPSAKRLFDLLLTLPGLVLISPLLGIIALITLLTEGRPVLFRQPRAGLHGKVFYIYKFRTMREAV